MRCRPSWLHVNISNSSSSVPVPPGSAITASDSSAISALRSCIVSTMCSLVSPACAISASTSRLGITPITFPPAAERGIGQRAHQAHAGRRRRRPRGRGRRTGGRARSRSFGVLGAAAGARAAEHKDPLHLTQGSSLAGVIRRLPHVDRVGVEERAAQLGKRSIKTAAKQQGIRLAVSMLDLTTLEGADTPGKVRHLCAKAVCPAPDDARDPVGARRSACTRRWSASAKRGARGHGR